VDVTVQVINAVLGVLVVVFAVATMGMLVYVRRQ
jgi:hypothetical protein